MTTYSGHKVTVVGLGREGLAVTRVLAREGAHVTVSDARNAAALAAPLAALGGLDVRLSLGGHRAEEVLDCDVLVLSPGVDKRTPLVREALRRGIRISSETELFLERCPARVVGITGSAGKTTTTTLVGEMLRQGEEVARRAGLGGDTAGCGPEGPRSGGSGRSVFVGGNIGRPLLERLDEITEHDWVVLELSSFQLEWLHRSPAIAAVTNITPNHLDRHETMEAYIAAKAHIVAYQGTDDVAVLNRDEPNAAALAACTPACVLCFSLVCAVGQGAFLDGETLVLNCDGRRTALCRVADVPVPGRHNVANALAAAAVAAACGVAPEAIGQAIRRFRGVPHRLQRLDTLNGVTFYDDSIATAPERTLAALAALDQPLVLILGGRDKHLPWEELAREATRRCRAIVLLGEAAPLIRRHLEAVLAAGESRASSVGSREKGEGGAPYPQLATPYSLRHECIVEETTMAGAVARAAALAQPGDAVVLSPGGTSYDMYRDFEERGDDFAREVRRLRNHV